MALLEIENLCVDFATAHGAFRAVDDVSLSVDSKEVLAIVGESGSGKSTVARCIVRLIQPTAGRVYLEKDEIAGLSVGNLRPHRKRIQIVFQDPYRSMNPRRTIGMSLIESPMNYGANKADSIEKAPRVRHELNRWTQPDVVGSTCLRSRRLPWRPWPCSQAACHPK